MTGGVSSPVAALILAAGLSSRMAPRNKLLIRNELGRPMVARVAEAALASRARDVFVVTGHQAEEVAQEVAGTGYAGRRPQLVHAPAYASGLSASLKAGLAALAPEIGAALVCLGDMPLVTSALMDAVIDAYGADEARLIVVPTCRGRRGNPVLWDRSFFAEIAALEGDTGARALLTRHARRVTEVETGEEAILLDFDTPDAFG